MCRISVDTFVQVVKGRRYIRYKCMLSMMTCDMMSCDVKHDDLLPQITMYFQCRTFKKCVHHWKAVTINGYAMGISMQLQAYKDDRIEKVLIATRGVQSVPMNTQN